jgi:hypothetical protein
MSKLSKLILSMSFLIGIILIPQVSSAGEIDLLIEKLVEKGVLTHGEAQQIVTETKEEMRTQLAKGKVESLPKWLQNMKLKGDLRLRYQYDEKRINSKSGRHRGRIRYRLGLDTKVNDRFQVGAGLASGGDDPRSTNETLKDTFETKRIQLDYAYAAYTAAPWATIYGGKMKRKPILWAPTDLLWDGDINPEGVALHFEKKINPLLFFNTGWFVLDADESSGNRGEPWMAYFQPGIEQKFDDGIKLKGAVTAYIINTKGWEMDHSDEINTTGSPHAYNYDAVSPAVEVSISDPFDGLVPYCALFGEYVTAFDPPRDETGYALGLKFGDKKVKDWGQWQFKYVYRRLERDAWPDFLPDSDAYDGDTNVKGHEFILKYGLAKNVTLGLDYYLMQPIQTLSGVSDHSNGSDNKQHLLQVDVVLKF